MKRVFTTLLLIIAVTALSFAALGQRVAPKGTFKGQVETLVAIARHNPEVKADYAKRLGKAWDQPGVLKVIDKMDIPDGSLVPDNAVMYGGKLHHENTYQRGADKGYLLKNTLTGEESWVKSCGQTYTPKVQPNWRSLTIYEETDIEVRAEANAEANSSSTSSSVAKGGNAMVVFNNPQPRFIPQQRVLTTVGTERQIVGGITWVVPTKVNVKNVNINKNVNNLSQSQDQVQAQIQAQSLAAAIGL